MPEIRKMEDAPKDFTFIQVLVDTSGHDRHETAPFTDDGKPFWTIGYSGEEESGDPAFYFAGWSWTQDVIVHSSAGTPLGWLPLGLPTDGGGKSNEA